MKDLVRLEGKKIHSVANEYKKNGYTVILETKHMPSFLRHLQVDMVALSDKDNVLVEVVSQASIKNRNKLEQLAKLVEGRKGWRFEVIVTNPKEDVLQDIPLQEIVDRINKAKELMNTGQELAGLLLAWSSTEAIMRALAENEGIKAKSRSPLLLTKTLYSLAIIGPATYETLVEAAKQRNAIAHGYSSEKPFIDVQDLVKELLNVTSALLSSLSKDIEAEKEQLSVDDLVEWFLAHYEDPANGVPYESAEGGYQYVFGGPYDPWEVLADEFSWVDEDTIEKAAKEIYSHGFEWIKIGQY